MATRRRQAPTITLVPALARIVSGSFGTESLFQRPLLRIVKVQGISMIAGPRTNPDDETEPREGDTLFAYRLFLTDGEYVVAAVLDPVLHPLVHDKILTGPGTYVRLTDYDVRTSPKKIATDKFTRFLKVRGLEVVYSPGIHFHPENTDADGDSVMGGIARTIGRLAPPRNPTHETETIQEEEDEVVVIKQEAASSQPRADFGLDGTRDREIDDGQNEYGLDIDEEEALIQLEPRSRNKSMQAHAMRPDDFATADERSLSPDHTSDDDDLSEEEILQLSQLEPKMAIKTEVINSTCKSTQKQKLPEEKLKSAGGLRDITGNTNGGLGHQIMTAKKVKEPLFYEKENGRGLGSSIIASSSKNPSGPDTSQKPFQNSLPLPRQDRGLSPGPSTSVQPFPIGPNTPQKSSRQTTPLTSPPYKSPQQPRPFEITKLGDLFDKAPKNKVDILAIISRIDDKTITRSIGVKRDMHLLDPTVERTVWLSVWVDPVLFKPAVGTLVLFRGLTVHKYDGRSLNAFSDLAGTRWYIIEPTEDMVPGVDKVKEWWRQKTVEETLKSFDYDDIDNEF
ncbi:hypothetical protein TWF106_002871 [Orbilia oligospora]|uniref:Uncharacterized protein n=1 Tax=Orbilia oligospora TaxID=2813651 RepID=A0A7C8UAT1_ORBOL|nr:hypothetical protein TWF679_001172 [Orbilia oligospora]KAF3201258.1 hypothetical protein TWF106_002871 [Orbilia oligospora]